MKNLKTELKSKNEEIESWSLKLEEFIDKIKELEFELMAKTKLIEELNSSEKTLKIQFNDQKQEIQTLKSELVLDF